MPDIVYFSFASHIHQANEEEDNTAEPQVKTPKSNDKTPSNDTFSAFNFSMSIVNSSKNNDKTSSNNTFSASQNVPLLEVPLYCKKECVVYDNAVQWRMQ